MKPLPTRTMLEAFADLAYRKHDGPHVRVLELPRMTVPGRESATMSLFFPVPCSPRELLLNVCMASHFVVCDVHTGNFDELEFYTPPVKGGATTPSGLPLVGHPCPLGTSMRMTLRNVTELSQRLQGLVTYAPWEASSHV